MHITYPLGEKTRIGVQISVNRGKLPQWAGKAPLKIRYSGKNI